MSKSLIFKSSIIGLTVAGAALAGAQTNGPAGLTVRAGVFFPTSSVARDISANWFAVGADYKLNSLQMSAPGVGMLAYLGISADFYSSGDDSALPVALTYNIRSGQFVYSLGAGVDFVRIGANTSGFAGQLGASYDFGTSVTPFVLSAKYYFSSNADLSGIGVFAGLRF